MNTLNQEHALAASTIVLQVDMFQFEMTDNLVALVARNDPDTLYYQQAIKAPNRKELIKAMQEEIDQHII